MGRADHDYKLGDLWTSGNIVWSASATARWVVMDSLASKTLKEATSAPTDGTEIIPSEDLTYWKYVGVHLEMERTVGATGPSSWTNDEIRGFVSIEGDTFGPEAWDLGSAAMPPYMHAGAAAPVGHKAEFSGFLIVDQALNAKREQYVTMTATPGGDTIKPYRQAGCILHLLPGASFTGTFVLKLRYIYGR